HFEVAFLELVKLIIVSSHRYPDNASREHSKRDVESKAFFDSEIGQLSLNQKKQHVLNILNAKPIEITFFEFIELVIISMHCDPIQMLVVMTFNDLKFGDNDDSTFGVNISSRFPVDRKTIDC
nr:hypothetical protein [Tanacetum cinerariifolium]